MSGRVAFAPLDRGALRSFVGDRIVWDGPGADLDATSPTEVVVVGIVDDDISMGDALEIALSGVDQILTVSPTHADALRDDLRRGGIEVWCAGPVDDRPEWASLLDAMATGASLLEAARRANLSQRSAYRKLAEARHALGVESNTAAIVEWVRVQPRSA